MSEGAGRAADIEQRNSHLGFGFGIQDSGSGFPDCDENHEDPAPEQFKQSPFKSRLLKYGNQRIDCAAATTFYTECSSLLG